MKRSFVAGMVLVALMLTSGCVKLWQESLDVKTYMIEAPRLAEAVGAPVAEKLWVDTVYVLPPYNVRNLVIRESDVQFESSYYTELLLSPGENIRNNAFNWFSRSGLFEEVTIVDRKSMSHRLIITLLELYGDKSGEGERAVISLRVALLDEQDKEQRVLLSKDYHQKEMVDEISAEALIRAYNRALVQILTECEEDIQRIMVD